MDISTVHPETSNPGHSFSFPRSKRLKRRKSIQKLFSVRSAESRSVKTGFIRILFSIEHANSIKPEISVLTGFAVGRTTGNAVTRNRVKRILREEFRRQQHETRILFSGTSKVLNQMIVFRGDPRQEDRIRSDMGQALRKLCELVRRELSNDTE